MLPPTPPAIVSPAPAAGPWIPAERPWATQRWLAQHDAFVARAQQGNIDVLFLGDSITAYFPTRGKDVWDREIAPLGTVANFGIEGDRTQFLLWRIEHGELDGIAPRAVVLLIGTNNLRTATPDAIAHGVAEIVGVIREKLPDTTVLLNALLPRGGPSDPLRAKAEDVNARIEDFADGDHVRWVDASWAFLTPNGAIDGLLMPDTLHPSSDGYERWAMTLRPPLLKALSK